jgi:hypothetical protein
MPPRRSRLQEINHHHFQTDRSDSTLVYLFALARVFELFFPELGPLRFFEPLDFAFDARFVVFFDEAVLVDALEPFPALVDLPAAVCFFPAAFAGAFFDAFFDFLLPVAIGRFSF